MFLFCPVHVLLHMLMCFSVPTQSLICLEIHEEILGTLMTQLFRPKRTCMLSLLIDHNTQDCNNINSVCNILWNKREQGMPKPFLKQNWMCKHLENALLILYRLEERILLSQLSWDEVNVLFLFYHSHLDHTHGWLLYLVFVTFHADVSSWSMEM
jgi:hypothetical protein